MTTMRPLLWRWGDHRMVGMLHACPAPRGDTGSLAALLLPGGAQTRTGTGRALTALARQLAAQGIATLTIDWAGQGDSEGPIQPFTERAPQIAAARHALWTATGITRHLLIGLCDGASAALLYAGPENTGTENTDAEDAGTLHMQEELAGLVLINCWMRDDDLAPPKGWIKQALARRMLGLGAAARKRPALRPFRSRLAAAWRMLRQRSSGEGELAARLRTAATGCRVPILWVIARADPTGRDAWERLKQPRWRAVTRQGRHGFLFLKGEDHGLLDPRNRLAVVAAIPSHFPTTAGLRPAQSA